jgi:hypothetical protein
MRHNYGGIMEAKCGIYGILYTREIAALIYGG